MDDVQDRLDIANYIQACGVDLLQTVLGLACFIEHLVGFSLETSDCLCQKKWDVCVMGAISLVSTNQLQPLAGLSDADVVSVTSGT